jgi:hypothetical protein
MTTVLAVYNSEGCVGRCDANCYNATNPHCNCICGGKNHSLGLERAIQHNHEFVGLTDEDLKRFAEERGYDPQTLKVYDTLKTPARQIRKEREAERKRAAWQARMELHQRP